MRLSGIADECADEIEEQVRAHLDLGWQYIEIRNVDRATVDTMDAELFEHVATTLAAHHVQASCLASDVGKLWLDGDAAKPFDQDAASLRGLAAKAKRLECRYIRVMGYRTESLPDTAWRDESVARLKDLCAIARDGGVVLALENCVGWHAQSGRRMCEFLDRVGSDRLVCLYDTANARDHDCDPTEFYEAVADRVAYIHVKDTAPGGRPFTFPGEGTCGVRHVLEDQLRRGYQGFVSIEPHMAPSAHMRRLKSDQGPPGEVYRACGRRLNEMLADVAHA